MGSFFGFGPRAALAYGLLAAAACGGDSVGEGSFNQVALPAEGSCEAIAMLIVANEASLTELDDDMKLDSRAAENIVAARPINKLKDLDAIAYVAGDALGKILAHADTSSCTAPQIPLPGTCEAKAMVKLANEATLSELDDDMKLDKRAAENIVAARPIANLPDLDAVSYVGEDALYKILAHTDLAPCAGGSAEWGIVSDLDKTVVPPADPDLSEAPYPGVTRLYQILEQRNGGAAGDMYYVTARQPEMVTEIPDYLEQHDVPAGPIETGVSGLPWVAEPEKIADVSSILNATGDQAFLLFGDSSHRDPEVYKAILATYGSRIVAGFIHKVNATVAPHRVEGLHLHQSYAEVAAILYGLSVITRDEAQEVMESAQSEGLAITGAEIEALLDQYAP